MDRLWVGRMGQGGVTLALGHGAEAPTRLGRAGVDALSRDIEDARHSVRAAVDEAVAGAGDEAVGHLRHGPVRLLRYAGLVDRSLASELSWRRHLILAALALGAIGAGLGSAIAVPDAMAGTVPDVPESFLLAVAALLLCAAAYLGRKARGVTLALRDPLASLWVSAILREEAAMTVALGRVGFHVGHLGGTVTSHGYDEVAEVVEGDGRLVLAGRDGEPLAEVEDPRGDVAAGTLAEFVRGRAAAWA